MSEHPYRSVDLRPDPYMVAWALLHRRRRVVCLGFVSFLIVLSSAIVVASAPTGFEEPSVALVVAALALVAAAVVTLLWVHGGAFACPHCETRFFWPARVRGGFVDRCPGCRIAVGTPRCSAQSAAESAAAAEAAAAYVATPIVLDDSAEQADASAGAHAGHCEG